MKPAQFRYHSPKTLEEAVKLLAEVASNDGRVIAGGQSLVPTMAFRMATPGDLVDINKVEGLDRLAIENGTLRVGALVRHSMFGDGQIPGATGRLLSKVMHNIAHLPIRTRGTFCGSLAHSDPSSEWCTVAAALDAKVIAHSLRGIRRIHICDYFTALMTTSLEPDELVSEVQLQMVPENAHVGFWEFSRRAGDFALAMSLAVFEIANGLIVGPRLAVGGAESFPRRLTAVEKMLAGRPAVAATWREAADLAAITIEPMQDATNSAEFRRDLVRSVTLRALEQAIS